MKIIAALVLILCASCAKPAPVVQQPLVPPPEPVTALQQCCVESGGRLEAGCSGAEAASYATCLDRVATLDTICDDGTTTTSGCSSCPADFGEAEGPLVLDHTAEVSEGDEVVRLAQVSGCSDAPLNVALHRKGDVAWTRVGEPLALACKPQGDVAFVCGDDHRFLHVDVEANTVEAKPLAVLGALESTEPGITLGTAGRGGSGYGRGVGDLGEQKRVARIVPGKPVVQGSLDKEIVRRVVRQHRRELKYCYEQHLKAVPDFAGRTVVKFTIADDGTVASATVSDRTVAAPPMEKCLVEKVRRWVFPEPKGGGIVIVNYPFNFSI